MAARAQVGGPAGAERENMRKRASKRAAAGAGEQATPDNRDSSALAAAGFAAGMGGGAQQRTAAHLLAHACRRAPLDQLRVTRARESRPRWRLVAAAHIAHLRQRGWPVAATLLVQQRHSCAPRIGMYRRARIGMYRQAKWGSTRFGPHLWPRWAVPATHHAGLEPAVRGAVAVRPVLGAARHGGRRLAALAGACGLGLLLRLRHHALPLAAAAPLRLSPLLVLLAGLLLPWAHAQRHLAWRGKGHGEEVDPAVARLC